jgi:hypothetical protein
VRWTPTSDFDAGLSGTGTGTGAGTGV